jgi:hypothetical protein
MSRRDGQMRNIEIKGTVSCSEELFCVIFHALSFCVDLFELGDLPSNKPPLFLHMLDWMGLVPRHFHGNGGVPLSVVQ